MLKYPARHYDEHLKLKVSFLLWLVLIYAVRHSFIYYISSAIPFEAESVTWLNLQANLFFIGCDIPALLVLIATGHRVPNAFRVMRWIWLHGHSLLMASYVLSLCGFMVINRQVLLMPDAEGFLATIVLVVVDAVILIWLWRSAFVRDLFTEFPSPEDKAQAKPKIKSSELLLAQEIQRNKQRELLALPVLNGLPAEPFVIATDALPNTGLETAAVFEAKNQWREAEWVYRALLDRWPDCADAWHAFGLLAYQAGKREHGVELVLEAMRLDGKSGLYRRNIGEMYRRMGRLDDATHYAKLACKLSPDDVEVWHYYGLALTNAKRFEEAIVMYRKVVELDPKHVQCWNNLGVALQTAGKAAEAENAYKKALSLNAGYVEAQTNLKKLLAA